MTTDKELCTAIRALPHMAITKKDGEYRVTYRLASIVAVDEGGHDADWHRAMPSAPPTTRPTGTMPLAPPDRCPGRWCA